MDRCGLAYLYMCSCRYVLRAPVDDRSISRCICVLCLVMLLSYVRLLCLSNLSSLCCMQLPDCLMGNSGLWGNSLQVPTPSLCPFLILVLH
uniref:Uncharacterized protein n=1 Tax=Leersia perrieri TaxID=77586 RepID=A0A0D9WQ53_9ORYZ